jgi:1,4-dihydroxy-2-naphthoate polyprenyltransferase
MGTAYAWSQTNEISWLIFCLCLLFAFFMQIGANFANDYYDFCKGADGEDRIGPVRAVASGAISPRTMRMAAFVVLALGFGIGLLLLQISDGGWPLLAVGVASVACALAYTCGPWPLAYLGLGDLFVIFFFGLVALPVTHYVQLRSSGILWDQGQVPWVPAIAVGLIINNLLIVNNHRDAETDRRVGKLTLVARFGQRFGVAFYFLAILVAALIFPLIEEGLRGTILLLPLGCYLGFRLSRSGDSRNYNFIFAGTAAIVFLYGGLTIVSLAGLFP